MKTPEILKVGACLLCVHLSTVGGFALEFFELPESPAKWIETLRKNGGTCTLSERILNYVDEEDLAKLIALLDSDKPCAHVSMVNEGKAPKGRSTVGDEAAHLVNAFRMRYYPAFSSSAESALDKDALKAWYKTYTLLKSKAK